MVVLASWQQNQYPDYSAEYLQDQSYIAQAEPVRVRINNQPSIQQPAQPTSFVQSLNSNGRYVQVF